MKSPLMLPAGLDPPELLQTSDLNQLPLETFLRTGTKLSMIIQLNHHWCLLPFWLGKDLRSGKRRFRILYRNKDCMAGHAVLRLWRIRSIVSDQSDLDQRQRVSDDRRSISSNWRLFQVVWSLKSPLFRFPKISLAVRGKINLKLFGRSNNGTF